HRALFVKTHARAPAGMFGREAEGLLWLAEANAVRIAQVVAVSDGEAGNPDAPAFLALEWIESAAQARDHDEHLGRGLAALHRRAAQAFGFPVTTYCGSTPQDNGSSTSWAEFYAERRLRPLVRRLTEAGGLSSAEGHLFDRVCERLPGLVADGAPPALIHGDLWSGNVLASTGGPALVDPACTYADRELEFGITTLFGGFAERLFAAYEEAWPLPAGWRERNPLYQAYHLLNHHLIFGGHYGAAAVAAARRYV
ncbi:MAG TPA: fructosamine kinase family protein, partial [Vicinamibacteria bacterium]